MRGIGDGRLVRPAIPIFAVCPFDVGVELSRFCFVNRNNCLSKKLRLFSFKLYHYLCIQLTYYMPVVVVVVV